jgi:hypothetical protein
MGPEGHRFVQEPDHVEYYIVQYIPWTNDYVSAYLLSEIHKEANSSQVESLHQQKKWKFLNDRMRPFGDAIHSHP